MNRTGFLRLIGVGGSGLVLPASMTSAPAVDAQSAPDWHLEFRSTARTASSAHPLSNAVLRRDIETGEAALFDFGANVITEKHVFVSVPGCEGNGWLIGTALDLDRQVSVLSVFAAGALADGPVVQARLPYPVPLGFHGNWKGA
ncbi:carotenoid oxygenase family protein [Aquisalimonas sp.]|uniref:carotenoid oxygenase family protein n=1 Tax=Aquisalimonas sp. TaxID=1872621 RepID=UPI0025C649D0|nr:carotenoid oxygenase family protein [Aquisalimonas sp.]